MGQVEQKHPRLRGEDLTPDVQMLRLEGNTPAYAGKTLLLKRHLFYLQKHPRLRGEDCQVVERAPRDRETPPLTRGRLLPRPGAVLGTGNTPAYAGKTSSFMYPTTP